MHYLTALGDLIKLYNEEDSEEEIKFIILQILQGTEYMSLKV
jgi:hypothetical protein